MTSHQKIALAAAGLGLFLLALLIPSEPAKPNVQPVRQPAPKDLPALRSRAAELHSEVSKESHRVETLRADIASAKGYVQTLPAEIARLSKSIPRLEDGLEEWRTHLREATELRENYETRYQALLRSAPSEKRIADAERERDGFSIRSIAEQYYGPYKLQVLNEDREHARKYIAARDKFLAHRRLLAEDVSVAKKVVADAESQLADIRSKLARASQQLTRGRHLLKEGPSLLAAGERRLQELQADEKYVGVRLAAAESAAKRRAASTAKSERDRMVQQSPRQVASTPTPIRTGPSGFARLPRHLQMQIYAEAAGVDTGLDLLSEDRPTSLANILPEPPASYLHADGRGVTHVQGNQKLVQRVDGPSSLYTRDGDWETHEMSHGVWGARYYDDFYGVTRFDYRNPNTGIRTIGEQPYPDNDFGQGWSQQMWGW